LKEFLRATSSPCSPTAGTMIGTFTDHQVWRLLLQRAAIHRLSQVLNCPIRQSNSRSCSFSSGAPPCGVSALPRNSSRLARYALKAREIRREHRQWLSPSDPMQRRGLSLRWPGVEGMLP
jgi:hypothetical protein